MKALSVFLLVVALVAAPLGTRPASAIAHGEDGSYPFATLLTMTGLPAGGGGRRDSSCSGALIAERWVITAGHCFRDASGRRVNRTVAERTTAVVGRADLTGGDGVEVPVADVHQAPDNADVALVELGAPVTGITPLRLSTTPPAPGETVRLAGYGLTSSDESATTTRLQTGRFEVDAVGEQLIETSGFSPSDLTSPCPHDSGGPYFREDGGAPVLVAVVSTGPGCPHPGPDFSARTDTLGGWIADTMAGGGAVDGFVDDFVDGFADRRPLGFAAFFGLAAVLGALVVAGLRRRGARR